ncbi:hypothetical protein ACH4TX_00095 [Streptomyces sp. NPDC021098]
MLKNHTAAELADVLERLPTMSLRNAGGVLSMIEETTGLWARLKST